MKASIGDWHGNLKWRLWDLDDDEDTDIETHKIVLEFERGTEEMQIFFDNPARARKFIEDMNHQAREIGVIPDE